MTLRVHYGLTDGETLIEYARKIVWSASAPDGWVRENEGQGQWLPRSTEGVTVELSPRAREAQAGGETGAGSQDGHAEEARPVSAGTEDLRTMTREQLDTQTSITLMQTTIASPSGVLPEMQATQAHDREAQRAMPEPPEPPADDEEAAEAREAARREEAEREPAQVDPDLPQSWQRVGWVSGLFASRRPQ